MRIEGDAYFALGSVLEMLVNAICDLLVPAGLSPENEADLYVGGTSEGGHLAGTLDFTRIAL